MFCLCPQTLRSLNKVKISQPMQSDYEVPMRKLIKTVVRTFYEPHHAVIADILLENVLLSDSDFCSRMKMLNREFNRLIVRLKDDRLVKSDIKVEVKEENKQILRTVYFFNYAEARDIIKYKIFKMTKALEVKKMSADEAFYCLVCERSFSTLDAQASMENFVFRCIFCKNELCENVAKSEHDSISMKELLKSLETIIRLLKNVDKFTIPTLDYFQVLEMKKERENCALNRTGIQETKGDYPPDPPVKDDKECSEEYSDDFDPVVPIQKLDDCRSDLVGDYVTVSGVKKSFSEVTEEDKDLMDEDEYTKYFEMYSKHNN